MAAEVHVGDIGTEFRPRFFDQDDVVINIATATVKYVLFTKPDGRTFKRTLQLFTDGTDGKGQYFAVAGDLDQAGDWEWQGYVEVPAGHWHTTIHAFPVKPNLR